MDYSNPEIPEGINTSKAHPLKEFMLLTVGVVGSLLLLVAVIIIVVDFFADKIPFEWEEEIPLSRLWSSGDEQDLHPYLVHVSQKVIRQIELPEEMVITVHYVNDDIVNAYATLGGHVVIYRGLLEKLRYEDELAMVLAHEVAHVKYRHPILSASHGLVVSIVLSLISSTSNDDVINWLLGTTGMVSLVKFSRDYEYQADQEAIKTLIALYGKAEGAIGLFQIFKAEMDKPQPVEFLSTHPLTDNRISQTKEMINAYSVLNHSAGTPLQDEFISWLQIEKERHSSDK